MFLFTLTSFLLLLLSYWLLCSCSSCGIIWRAADFFAAAVIMESFEELLTSLLEELSNTVQHKCFCLHWLPSSCSCCHTNFFAAALAVESFEELLSTLLLLMLQKLLKSYLTQCNTNVLMYLTSFLLLLLWHWLFCCCYGLGIYWRAADFSAVASVVGSIEEVPNRIQHKCFVVCRLLFSIEFFAVVLVMEFIEELPNTIQDKSFNVYLLLCYCSFCGVYPRTTEYSALFCCDQMQACRHREFFKS